MVRKVIKRTSVNGQVEVIETDYEVESRRRGSTFVPTCNLNQEIPPLFVTMVEIKKVGPKSDNIRAHRQKSPGRRARQIPPDAPKGTIVATEDVPNPPKEEVKEIEELPASLDPVAEDVVSPPVETEAVILCSEKIVVEEQEEVPSRLNDAESEIKDDETIPIEGATIGIDLGTTHSSVAVWQNGGVKIIGNDQDSCKIPSYVAFSDTKYLVGDAAKDQVEINASNTIFDTKRLIGRNFGDASVQTDMENWPFTVVQGLDGEPLVQVCYKGEMKQYSAEQISSLLIVSMKKAAEAFLGCPVMNVVVTVPANFNNSQRRATKDAIKMSGLRVLRMLNESTAAAIAFSLLKGSPVQNVLIFKIGAGTIDVSVLAINKGEYKTLAVAGDTHLGGDDFDIRLVKHFSQEFNAKTGKDMTKDKPALARLRTACNTAKHTLSNESEARIDVQSLFEGENFSVVITRTEFEALLMDLFLRCVALIQQALSDSQLSKTDVQDIVMVGPSAHIPKVLEMVSEFFDGRDLETSVDPNAVIIGTTVMSAVISNQQECESIKDTVVVELAPLSLGTDVRGGIMSVLIKRNTPIPAQVSSVYFTCHHQQSSMGFHIYEGERKLVAENNLLDEFSVTGIPILPRGEAKVKLIFDVNRNNILEVTAVDLFNGKKINVIVKKSKMCASAEEIARRIKESEENLLEDQMEVERVTAREDLLAYIEDITYIDINKGNLSDEAKNGMAAAVADVEAWIKIAPKASTVVFKEKHSLIKKIMSGWTTFFVKK